MTDAVSGTAQNRTPVRPHSPHHFYRRAVRHQDQSSAEQCFFDARPADAPLAPTKSTRVPGALHSLSARISAAHNKKGRPKERPCLNANFLPRGDGNFSLPRHRPDSASHREGLRIWYRQGSCGVCHHDPDLRHNRNSPSGNATYPELQP